MFLLLQACALFTTIDPLVCETPADCIDTFGIGNTCQSDGYCAPIEPIDRCQTSHPSDFWDNPSAYEGAFVMGQMFDFEADASKLAATDLAFNDILETGSNDSWLDGKPLVRITCNYQNNAGDALTEKDAVETVTDFLVNTVGVEIIVGPAGSQDSLYATNLSDRKALFISPSATADSLKPLENTYSDEDPGLFWRTTGPDTLQSKQLDKYITDAQFNNVAILYQASIYGRGIGATLRNLREDVTGEIPATDIFEINDSDSIPGKINTLLSDTSIDALVFISDNTTDLMTAITTMRTSTYENIPLLLTDSAAKVEFLSDLRDYTGGNAELETSIINQITGTKPSVPNSSQYDEFLSRLSNLHGVNAQSSAFTAHAYDATWLAATALLYAHENENPHDINGLARGLRMISDPNHSQVELSSAGWNQIKDRLSANQKVNVLGTSGDLDYDPNTEELTTSIDIWKIAANLTTFEVIDQSDNTDTNTPDDTGDTGDVGDTGDTGDTGNMEISPDTVEISFRHGFDGANVINVAMAGSSNVQNGEFTIALIDSTTGDQCTLQWVVNTGTVTEDPNFIDGKLNGDLIDGVITSEVNVWYGFLISGQPVTDPACSNLDSHGQNILTELQQAAPGFGYAPMASDFATMGSDMITNHPAGWSNIEDKVLVGMASMTNYSGDGSRIYYPINQTFVYKVITTGAPWTTQWDPTVSTIPQGNETVTEGTRNVSGFYVSDPYFSFDAPLQ